MSRQPMIGQSCGNYRIVAKIGAGGMGVVYLARHKLIESDAVIKVLLPEYSHDRSIVTRFFNEAKAAAAVKHPSIIAIHDFGYHDDGSAYIVMEHLIGETLSVRLRTRENLDRGRALDIAWQIADGLSAVHACGIVHRDLKPDNLFLVPDSAALDGERVKILDFGIAKLTAPEHSSNTRTGVVMGTPAYMAPEQCRGVGTVDARADLYSLGCILFEMLCGQPPFRGAGAGDLIAAHILEPAPALGSIAPGTPPEVEALVARLLEKDPADRFQSARETMEAFAALGGAARGRGTTSRPYHSLTLAADKPTLSEAAVGQSVVPTKRPRRSRWLLASALVLAVAGAVTAVLLATGGTAQVSSASEPSDRAPIAPSTAAPTPASEPAPVGAPERAADGQVDAGGDAVTTVRVSLMSEPPGAIVLLDERGEQLMVGVIHGEALVLSYPAVGEQRVFVIRKDGYQDQRLAVPGDADVEQTVQLQREPTAERSPKKHHAGSSSDGRDDKRADHSGATSVESHKDVADDKVDTSHKNPFEQ